MTGYNETKQRQGSKAVLQEKKKGLRGEDGCGGGADDRVCKDHVFAISLTLGHFFFFGRIQGDWLLDTMS